MGSRLVFHVRIASGFLQIQMRARVVLIDWDYLYVIVLIMSVLSLPV